MNCPYNSGGTRLSGPFIPEGRACRVRRTPIDNPSVFTGHDERAPPKYPGGTCLSRPPCNVRLSIPLHRARQACPSEV